ncbi:hypothetical protein PENANT_c001G09098 [Penicillium antarcticum]|uniref:Palmitoyltransferase n=1 Tax=Penicillium antarcticum TaxID=416450 RepID=A0A1V6QNB1_9EURO|nr:hypothetical protein PENANT_c001G09098 [Penicillium antarcticum]
MATLASSPPTSPSWPKRRPRAWALRCERYCCAAASCFPLVFVYGLTTWAVYVAISIGIKPSKSDWIGIPSTALAFTLYALLNFSYTVAVFTDPGSPTRRGADRHEYNAVPVSEHPEFTSYTVSSTAFLLFLIYTSLFCWVVFGVASIWIWTEILNDTQYMDTILPVNVVLLAILGGIIGLVLTGFTAWHISLAVRGTTTIECLERTRYVSPLRKALDRKRNEQPPNDHYWGEPEPSLGDRLQGYGNQIIDAHANAIPGVTRAEEGEERLSPAPRSTDHLSGATVPDNHLTPAQQALTRSYAEMERQREHERYQEYQNDEDNEKMPSAFDHGWRRNLLHLFGERPLLWAVPVCTTTGDGWGWEPSEKFLEARDRMRFQREQNSSEEQQYYRELYQRNLDNSRSWRDPNSTQALRTPKRGTTPERPPTSVSMQTLAPRSPRPRPGDSDFEDEIEGNGLLDPGVGRPRTSRSDTDEWRDWD